jgi:hypothetical protein
LLLYPEAEGSRVANDASAAFISYSRQDSEFALRLAADLKAASANVWLDQLDIAPGERWDRAVEQALQRCPRMLLILSPAAVESDNVMDEVSFALDERKTIIPIMFEDCIVPFRLRRVQYIDCRRDYQGGLKGLISALGTVPATTKAEPATRSLPEPVRPELTSQPEPARAPEEAPVLGGKTASDQQSTEARKSEYVTAHRTIVAPLRSIEIPLHQVELFLYNARVEDKRCLGPGVWTLEIQSPLGKPDLISNVLKFTKVCSAQFLPALINRLLPGLTLNHLPTPPTHIDARDEGEYFSVKRDGPCWEHIVKSGMVGLYLPSQIPAPQPRLIVLLDE